MNNFQANDREFVALSSKVLEVIRENHSFVIMPHINPDGDAIGSTVALCEFLRGIGKNAQIISSGSIPRNLDFLAKDYIICPDGFRELQKDNFKDGYGVFVLDCGDLMRIEDRIDIYQGSTQSVNIDHHITNTEFADVNVVYTMMSSTGELIYELINAMVSIDKSLGDISSLSSKCIDALYTAILSDTGGFRYSNTSPNTMKVAYELLNLGARAAEIGVNLFQTKPMSTYRAMKTALDNLQMYCGDKLALSYFTIENMQSKDIANDDIDGMVEMLRDIDTVEVSVVLRQVDEKLFKVSMRSKRYVDLTKIALLFEGGGHMRASGCKVKGELDESISQLVNAISGELENAAK